MSRASTSGVRRAKAFLDPSGLGITLVLLLFAVVHQWEYIPDKGVNLDGVNIVKLLKSLLDLALVGLDVDNEDEGVVLLNLLHRALGVERVDDDLVLIQAGLVRNALAGVLGRAREDQGLRAMEGRRETDLAGLVGVNLLKLSAVRSRGRCEDDDGERREYLRP